MKFSEKLFLAIDGPANSLRKYSHERKHLESSERKKERLDKKFKVKN